MKLDLNDWFKKLESHYGTLNILGEYLPGKRKINYYPMDSYLIEVVKIHERFHAIHHLTIDSRRNNEIWTNFGTKSPLYIELLAQLFTYRFCKDEEKNDPSLLHTFLDLSDRQHFVYQTWQIFKDYDWPQIIDLYWAIRNNMKIRFLEDLQKKISLMSSTPNPNSKNASMNGPSQVPQIMPSQNVSSKIVPRRPDYKIGTFHGKLHPDISEKEAILRNSIYLIGNIEIDLPQKGKIQIRVIGYEIPLGNKAERIDIVGYDTSYNLWIIELKKQDANEKLDAVIKQLNNYKNIILSNHLETYFEEEIVDKFFWKSFRFSNKINTMILAPREFFDKQLKKITKSDPDLYFCKFANMTDYDSLLSRLGSFNVLHLSLLNK